MMNLTSFHSPPFTWKESTVTFLGSLFTLFILSSINHSLVESFGIEAGLVMGPFGALMTLLCKFN